MGTTLCLSVGVVCCIKIFVACKGWFETKTGLELAECVNSAKLFEGEGVNSSKCAPHLTFD